MFVEMLFFVFAGVLLGVIFGLVPGLHPNVVVLFTPIIISLITNPLYAIAFLVALGVSNVIIDFIPSIILGAPDAEKELAVLPGHSMLLHGQGYGAVKLCVTGALASMILCVAIAPLLILAIPPLYDSISGFIWVLLVFAVSFIILSGDKISLSLFCFVASGAIGLLAFRLPVDSVMILFPVLSGFFAMSLLLFSGDATLPRQSMRDAEISSKARNRSVVLGTLGGVVSGFLPGLGASQVASLMSTEKSNESFLVTMGSISLSNFFLSLASLWLIEKSRSGIAVAVSYVSEIGFGEFLLITAVAVIAAGVSCIAALFITRSFVPLVGKINYSKVSRAVALFIVFVSFAFTGFYGLLLLAVCTALGVFASLAGVSRGLLMGVLIIPTIIFFIG